MPENSLLLTMDDGYYETVRVAYPIVKKYDLNITAFVVVGRTGKYTEMYNHTSDVHYVGEDSIMKIKSEYPKMRFEAHSYDLHRYINGLGAVYTKNYNDCLDDMKKCIDKGYDYVAYPYGFVTDDLKRAAEDSGMKMAFGSGSYRNATRRDDQFNIHRVKINGQITMKEFEKKLMYYN